ncbi:hypothetical protein P171DRAFT_435457 [Karstenula rhodostoma CBS 690.94]|uniref:Uncharacterized protein n=1 Tax=Karstenula rhodostoma CBS 690.94 TaxID=1392251 RepID=A0A9P4P941_9PLEO|nr:hypothetical protein P171DRAFT_435457 [Karstenula rhodostoma CBS 690.94]
MEVAGSGHAVFAGFVASVSWFVSPLQTGIFEATQKAENPSRTCIRGGYLTLSV